MPCLGRERNLKVLLNGGSVLESSAPCGWGLCVPNGSAWPAMCVLALPVLSSCELTAACEPVLLALRVVELSAPNQGTLTD